MRTPLVIGNWKLHGSTSEVEALIAAIPAVAGVEMAVCPPYVYLPQASGLLAGSAVGLGAQNCAGETSGAFTGEVAATMLADVGCQYVLIGHSERRTLFAETDAGTVAKVRQVLDAGLQPVLCVGETLEERELGHTLDVVLGQQNAVLDAFTAEELGSLILAYEPVWAIGTGRTASAEQAQEVHAAMRSKVAEYSDSLAAGVRILYGGSVKPGNAQELFAQADIDGGLIGGAALVADDFMAICQAAGSGD
ncbi:MAG: triose-phosphate isomerase [Pseudomonadales bacterium]